MEDKEKHDELGEDATKYGEFVCSAFHWLPLKTQKKQAEKLEKMTENNRNN